MHGKILSPWITLKKEKEKKKKKKVYLFEIMQKHRSLVEKTSMSSESGSK